MNELLDSFWRAALYCLHPRVILLSLLPLLITAAIAALLGYFFWTDAVLSLRATLDSWAMLQTLLGWLEALGIGGSGLVNLVAPLIALSVAVPVMALVSLLLVSVMMTPALVKLVAARRFPLLAREQGGSLWQSLVYSVASTVLALLALVVSVPFWLVPPLVAILPPLIWGWLTYRVMSFDALAEHASPSERAAIMSSRRWPLIGMGVACGYLGSLPVVVWALHVVTFVLAPLFVAISVWLYTLVFAFSALWFAHYLLAALQDLREHERTPTFPVAALAP